MLLETQFHRVFVRVVLRKRCPRHQCKQCMFCWGLGNVGWVLVQWHSSNVQRLSDGLGVHSNFTCCLVSKVRGLATFAKPLMNFL